MKIDHQPDLLLNFVGQPFIMACAYALATRLNLTKGPRFLTTETQITNMSMMGLSTPRPINVEALFRFFTEERGYVYEDLLGTFGRTNTPPFLNDNDN